MQSLKKLIVRSLAAVGALVLVGMILGLGCMLISRKTVPSKVILEADFETHLVEYVPDDPVARIVSGRAPTTLGVVEALERASTDSAWSVWLRAWARRVCRWRRFRRFAMR